MSTLRAPMSLQTRTVVLGLVSLSAVAVAGCTSTGGSRFASLGAGPPSKAKTYLAVGDKPLPVVTGEPGSSVAADTDPADGPKRAALPEARISGRVYDADGAPVPNARVRLAVSGALGGKVVSASTDRSGAFTLRGLRPSSTYTVIAEWTGNNGKLSGRASAQGSDTEVRITLAPTTTPGADGADDPASPNRVRGISGRAAPDEERQGQDEILPGTPGEDRNRPPATPRVNEEDLPPPAEAGAALAPAPAPEAEAMAPSAAEKRRDAVSSRRSAPASWRRGQGTEGIAAAPPAESGHDSAGDLDVTRSPHGQDASGTSAPEDEGPNPLPPAIDPSSAARPDPAAQNDEAFAPKPKRDGQVEPTAPLFDPARLASRAKAPDPGPATPARGASAVTSTWPGSQSVVPKTYAPVILDPEQTPSRPAPEMFDQDPARAPEVQPSKPVTAEPQPEPTADRRRPTWGEVTASRKDSSSRPAAHTQRVETTAAQPAVPASKTKADASTVFCDYDDRHRRLIDFRLPDLDGNPVRFKDIDADLVLIDFWGTWCAPCLDSIPHLVELQDRMKGKKLVVIGVACEPDAPEKAAAKVAAAARKMNMNYPVLLSKNDGTCPLQEAFRVQAFPTMILIDREGRVLWRDQGATAATLARLDRMVSDPPTQR